MSKEDQRWQNSTENTTGNHSLNERICAARSRGNFLGSTLVVVVGVVEVLNVDAAKFGASCNPALKVRRHVRAQLIRYIIIH